MSTANNIEAAPRRTGSPAIIGRAASHENTFLLAIVAALVIVFTILTPAGTFFSSANFKNIALDTSEILILAAGSTFVVIAAGIDLSIGSVVVFSAVIFAKLVSQLAGTSGSFGGTAHHLWLAIPVSVVAAVAAGAAWGFFNGFLTAKLRMPSFIVTLGTLGMALGFAQIITGGLNVPNVPTQLQLKFGGASVAGIPWLVVVSAAVVGVLWIVLARTRFGLRTYSLGANAEGTRRAGVNIDRQLIGVFVLMGLMAGIVGVLDVCRFGTASVSAHTQDNLAAIAAVVIGGSSLFGGKGRMSGTIIGAFIPAILRNGFILLGVQPFWQNVAVGAVLILAVFLDQQRRLRQNLA
jgi:ribose transport system permease protein